MIATLRLARERNDRRASDTDRRVAYCAVLALPITTPLVRRMMNRIFFLMYEMQSLYRFQENIKFKKTENFI